MYRHQEVVIFAFDGDKISRSYYYYSYVDLLLLQSYVKNSERKLKGPYA